MKPFKFQNQQSKSALIQVSYETLKIPLSYSIDDSGVQKCLQHGDMLVPVRSEHMFTSLISHLAGAQVNVY